MKTLTKALAIAALTASFAAPSFASIADDIRRIAATNGSINVDVRDDTVILTGYVEDSYARQLAEQRAKKEGYKVKNYLILSD